MAAGLLFAAALAPGVPAGAAQPGPASPPLRAVAGEPAKIGPLPGGPLPLRVEKLRSRSPWLFASYLPVGTVFEARVDAGDDPAPFTFVFWDEGSYRVEAAGARVDVEVATPRARVWATVGMFVSLAALGVLCGWTAGGLKRPARTGFAAALALFAAVHAALPSAGEAAAMRLARPGELQRVRVEPPEEAAKSGREARISLWHVEDRLLLFSFRTRVAPGGFDVAYAFPEGTEYRVDVEASTPEGASVMRSLSVEVEPIQPGAAAQARGFAVLAGWYGLAFLAAFALRRRHSIRQSGRAAGMGMAGASAP